MTPAWTLSALLLSVPAGAREEGTTKFQSVTVRPGDTLWSIADSYLKDPKRWSDILRYNRLPSSDPTVALPGLTLRVPVALIKEELRAALLVQKLGQVLVRKKESADWRDAALRMQLYRDDGLRTLAAARARVQFVNGEFLSLDQNSMAILKPKKRDAADLELLRGAVVAARSRVMTASARIVPKTRNTRYTASVRDDLLTRVEVLSGKAEVEGGGETVLVQAGWRTEVVVDRAPLPPSRIPDLPAFAVRVGRVAAVGEAPSGAAPAAPIGGVILPDVLANPSEFGQRLRQLNIGMPIAQYRVQASRARDFADVAFDRRYEPDERIDLDDAGLPAGVYWWRVAVVDLLGVEGKYCAPQRYGVGGVRAP